MATLEDAEIPVAAVGLPGVTAAIKSAAWRSSVQQHSHYLLYTAKIFTGEQWMCVGACMRVHSQVTSSTLF